MKIYVDESNIFRVAMKVTRIATCKGDIQKIVASPRGKKGKIVTELVALYDRLKILRLKSPSPASLKSRLNDFLIRLGEAEIDHRGLSTPAGWVNAKPIITDRRGSFWILHYKYPYKYSNRVGTWWQMASYLIGKDEGQRFAVRIPSTITTVDEALEWLKPREIREAEKKGLPVRRQGDMFFRPVRLRDHDMRSLQGTRHRARPRKDGGLTIVHPQHRPLVLSGRWKWRAYVSRQVHGVPGD